MNKNEELMDWLGDTYLWVVAIDYAERNIEPLKEKLREIGDIELEAVERINRVTMKESESFDVNGFTAKNGTLTVTFEMPIVFIANCSDKSARYRITTCCIGTVEIPDADAYDWESMGFEEMSPDEVLDYAHLAKHFCISYDEDETKVDKLKA